MTKPESTESGWHLGRGCGRSGRRLLRALGHASTDALPRVLVASFGSAHPASRSASPDRWIRALDSPLLRGQFSDPGAQPRRGLVLAALLADQSLEASLQLKDLQARGAIVQVPLHLAQLT